MRHIYLLILSLAFSMGSNAQILSLHPLYHSIGYEVNEIANYNLCQVKYKKSSASIWLDGHDADSILFINKSQFRGSLFLLDENTLYDIEITLTDRLSNKKTLNIVSTSTLKSPSFTPQGVSKWVSPNGTGTSYTEALPGNLNTLLASGQLACGTTVIMKDGVYSNFNMQLSFNSNCTENTPVQFMAAPGANPIIDGAYDTKLEWTAVSNDNKMYYANLPSECAYTKICKINNTSLYPYSSLQSEALLGNYNLSELSFGFDGFIRDGSKIYIKTNNGINPNNETITISKEHHFLVVYGNDKNIYLKFKGITFKNIAKPTMNNVGATPDYYAAAALDLRNVNHVYFDSCQFEYNTQNIVFSNKCSHILIQNCKFKDEEGKWSHAMIKKSHDFINTILFSIPTSRARGSENEAIFSPNSNKLVVRNCIFDGLNSSIASFIDNGLNSEIDIYNNVYIDNFDAIECDGNWSNLRIWNNEMIRPMAGLSSAPPLIGPRYIYRNTIHQLQGRRNVKNDPYFTGCSEPKTYQSAGMGFKTNITTNLTNKGNMYFYNNTFHTKDSLGYAITNWDAEWRKIFFKNNIFYDETKNPIYFHSLANKPYFHFNSNRDNFYSNNINSPIIIAKEVHGEYNCHFILQANQIQSQLRNISSSNAITIQNPLQQNPDFKSKLQGGFELNSSSTLINSGEIIKGFYDYVGTKPDIGAKETQIISKTNILSKPNTFFIYPNPAHTLLNIDFGQIKFGNFDIQIYDINGTILINQQLDLLQNHELNISTLANGFYFLKIKNIENSEVNIFKFFKI